MPIPKSILDLSVNEALNSPAGSDPVGGTLDNFLRALAAILKKQFVKGQSIPAASTLAIPAEGSVFDVTGAATINSMSGGFDGRVVVLRFLSALTIQHGAAISLPGQVNMDVAAGTVLIFYRNSRSQWVGVIGAAAMRWPTWAELSGKPSTFPTPLGTTKGTAKAGDWLPRVEDIADASSIGRAVLTAEDAATVRQTIGAGTSSLEIGTTSTTAKAGDWMPSWNSLPNKPGLLGDGQRWQTVARVSGTAYTNTTGKPIMVHVQSTGDRPVTAASITVQGHALLSQSYNGRTASISAVIPHGATYQVSGVPSMIVRELR